MMRLLVLVMLVCLLAFQAYAQEGELTIHVVQRGENLFRIALQYGMTTDELAQLNGITNFNRLEVGQRLLVPGANAEVAAPSSAGQHTIQAGETLAGIAASYNVSADALAAENGLVVGSQLVIGQILRIPETVVPEVDTAEAVDLFELDTVTHVTQPGETLFRIATQYGLTVNELASANGITDPSVVPAGQRLIIPGVEPPRIALDLPDPVTDLGIRPLVLVEGKSGFVQIQTAEPAALRMRFLGVDHSFFPDESRTTHQAYLGIPVFVEPGVYRMQFTVAPASGEVVTFEASIQVIAGSYISERISLLSGRETLLNEAVEDAETQLLREATAQVTPERFFDGSMSLPAAAPLTSSFGNRRSYNGGAFDRYHSGTDFAGAPGSPIFAPADGRVVLADTLNVRGRATMIDHGWGVYTGYWHQTEIYVAPGDQVERGQVIGTVGATGRVTGAHLHWELWVNGVPVDPMQWVQQSFS